MLLKNSGFFFELKASFLVLVIGEGIAHLLRASEKYKTLTEADIRRISKVLLYSRAYMIAEGISF